MSSDINEKSTSGSLSAIARGASVFTVGKVIYNIIEFLLNLLLTRALGASLYGIYAYASTLLTAALVLTNGGTDKSVLKYIPQYENDSSTRQFMLGLAFLTSAVGGILAMIILVFLAPIISKYTLQSTLFVNTLRVFAVIVLFDTLAKIINSTFRAIELLEYEILVDRLIYPTIRLVFVGIALYFSLTFIAVMTSLLVASVLALLISVWLFMTRLDIRPNIRGSEASTANIKSYYNYSLPLVAKDGASVLRSRIDILMVGFFLSSAAVGIYNIAILLTSLLVLPLSAFNQLFPPIASRLYSNNKKEKLNNVFSTLTRWTLTISLFLGIGAIVYRVQILTLFGTEFAAGSTVLILFVIGQLVNNAVGPSAYVLMMTEHQYVVLFNQWIFGIINILLNYILILKIGLIGAAVATSGTLILLNLTRVVEVWYFERLFPYTYGFVKPIVAGCIVFVIMYAIELVIHGWYEIFAGGILGGVVYLLILFVLGIEEDDKELFKEVFT